MIRAARYLGIAPWELAGRTVLWRNMALSAQNAETWADNELKRRQQG